MTPPTDMSHNDSAQPQTMPKVVGEQRFPMTLTSSVRMIVLLALGLFICAWVWGAMLGRPLGLHLIAGGVLLAALGAGLLMRLLPDDSLLRPERGSVSRTEPLPRAE